MFQQESPQKNPSLKLKSLDGFYAAIYKKMPQGRIKFLEVSRQGLVDEAITDLCNGDDKKKKHFGFVILTRPVLEYNQFIGDIFDSVYSLIDSVDK